ncbi:MAG: phosphate acyltransferase PlsX [Deltaproteobacteria bacterium]|nr:phosphate acyltransferase PlsX [Deltaproteobacteria bacterium]
MGGDRAPDAIVKGSVEAVREFDLSVILVGNKEIIERELAKSGEDRRNIEIEHCTQIVGNDESPMTVLRHKKDSSVRVAFNLVKSGRAQAAVSAGSSGATLAVATVVLGRIKGIERPAIATVLPSLEGQIVVIDVGATPDCKPSYLFQYGIMGHMHAQTVLGIERPRLALLSIGEETSKGNLLVRQVHDQFKASSLNFIGNIEGRDLFTGQADVIVCDGFVGNVVLKLSEGLAIVISGMLERELLTGSWPESYKILLKQAFERFQNKVDYAEFGGAPLLGIEGVGIVSHGRSSPKAIKNAIRNAAEFVSQNMVDRLRAGLDESSEMMDFINSRNH